MCRAFDSGFSPERALADEVYGPDGRFRRFLEERGRRGGKTPIYIGQGWQRATPAGFGVGKCCRGATGGTVAGCPPTALEIVEALAGR